MRAGECVCTRANWKWQARTRAQSRSHTRWGFDSRSARARAQTGSVIAKTGAQHFRRLGASVQTKTPVQATRLMSVRSALANTQSSLPVPPTVTPADFQPSPSVRPSGGIACVRATTTTTTTTTSRSGVVVVIIILHLMHKQNQRASQWAARITLCY